MAIRLRGTEGTCQWTIDDNGHLYIGSGVINHNTTGSGSWSWSQYISEIYSISSGNVSWTEGANACHMFDGCYNLIDLDLSNFDTSNVTNMLSMFEQCNKLKIIDLSNFNTINVSNMATMFASCIDLTDLNISGFNTTNVSTMAGMFYGCAHLTNLNISNFNTSQVTNMQAMFRNCADLTSLNLLSFDTRAVTNMNSMFTGCTNLLYLELCVNSNPTSYNSLFNSTSQNRQFFIINKKTIDPTTTGTATAEFWSSIAGDYDGVYYEGEGNTPPRITYSTPTKRYDFEEVSTNVYELVENDSGEWIPVTDLRITLYTDVLPRGWSNSLTAFTCDSSQEVRKADYSLVTANDFNGQNPVTTIYVRVEDQPTLVELTFEDKYEHSTTISFTSNPMFAMIDFMPGGKGMAIGKVASRNGLDVSIPTAIGEGLLLPTVNNTNEIDLTKYQLVVGQYNEQDNDALFIVGSGTRDNPKNLMLVKNGMITIGDSDYTYTILDEYGQRFYHNDGNNLLQIANIGYGNAQSEGGGVIDAPYYTFGTRKSATDIYDDTMTYKIGDLCIYNDIHYVCQTDINTPESWTANHWSIIIGGNSHAEGYRTVASNWASHAEGHQTMALGNNSHAEGHLGIDGDNNSHFTIAYGEASHAEGAGTFAKGKVSHAEGILTTASGKASHAEGMLTTASGNISHAEGESTIASDINSHAEGYKSIASGLASHAEGSGTIASGAWSHSQNYGTIAASAIQTALGLWNKADEQVDTFVGDGTTQNFQLTYSYKNGNALKVYINDEEVDNYTVSSQTLTFLTVPELNDSIKVVYGLQNYALIIGNGTADDARSNALTVDWDGNVVASGNVTAENLKRKTIAVSISTSTGTYISHVAQQFGNVVFLSLTFRNTASVASGSNIYAGTITATGARPVALATGGGYYGAHALIGSVNTNGAIIIRNASNTALSIGSGSSGTVSFVYLIS